MNARTEAEKRLKGTMDGTDWAKVDAIKGLGWALLAAADTIADALKTVHGVQPAEPEPQVEESEPAPRTPAEKAAQLKRRGRS